MFSLFFSKKIEIFYNRSFISLCPPYIKTLVAGVVR